MHYKYIHSKRVQLLYIFTVKESMKYFLYFNYTLQRQKLVHGYGDMCCNNSFILLISTTFSVQSSN